MGLLAMQFLGIDPGGKHAFGWCVLTVDRQSVRLTTGVGSGVAAIEVAASHLDGPPVAVGIDAPLYWVADGDRVADRAIRRAVRAGGGQSGTVAHLNSLRGACVVVGVMAAVAVHRRWPGARITESHPKALLRLLPDADAFVGAHRFATEHERDAAIGAWSAWAVASERGGWIDWVGTEQAPHFPTGFRVEYRFPAV